MSIASAAPDILAQTLSSARKVLPHRLHVWGLTTLLVFLFGWLLTLLPRVSDGTPISLSAAWVPQLGLTLSFYLDGLSLIFSLVIVGIGASVVLYAGFYFEEVSQLNRFYALLFAFMGAMLGLVMAGNLLTLFIAWELTSVVSFLLISFHGNRSEARTGALQALMVTGVGGLALLVGLVMLGIAAGSMELSEIIASSTLREHVWYNAFTVLILVGCFSKSAQWPFHFWLPGAMAAPTPASAYLHSATMVKAGIYLLARLYPALGDTPLWQSLLMAIGLTTVFIGAVWALRQRDLKAALAYSTVSQLGMLVALLGLPAHAGIKAVIVGILAHSLYKAVLFMVAGAVDHASGTRDLAELGGLAKYIPGWAVVAVLAGLSMAGLPPLLGFVAKETLLDAILQNPLALAVVVSSAALSAAMAAIFVWEVFWGRPSHLRDHWHDPRRGMLVGPAVLACGSLLLGIRVEAFVSPVMRSVISHDLHLTLFAGFNAPLLLSVLALIGGGLIFATRPTWRAWQMPPFPSGSHLYLRIIAGVETVADLVLRSQRGKLRYYLVVILCSIILLQSTAGLTHISGFTPTLEFNGGSVDILRGLLLLLTLATMMGSILFRRHLVAALSLGVAGYSVGGLFLLEPAPDVALVQFMVETLGTVLLIVMLARISPKERERAMNELWRQSRLGLLRDVAISVAIGVGVAVFALAAVTSRPRPETIATYHLQNSLPQIGVTDVVGAIVTDFRGMDTIIEITVLSVAALGVLTLLSRPGGAATWSSAKVLKVIQGLKWKRARQKDRFDAVRPVSDSNKEIFEIETPDTQPVSTFSTPLTSTVAMLLLPFALLVSMAQLLYGGDGPGDGFTAGVISGLGVALWYVVFGYYKSRRELHWLHPRRLIGIGLTLVIANAAFPLLSGQPFLAHLAFEQIHLPANLHLSSTLVYETGIFLTVLGAVSMIMEAIAFPKEADPL